MKKIARIIALISISVFAVPEISAQCTPDTVDCIDTGDPGQICPSVLPEVTVGELYDEVITVIAPDSVTDSEIGIEYIVIDSVKNLPPGIEYFLSDTAFYPDSIYCIQITGTPTLAGDYTLAIYVTVFVKLYGILVNGGQIIDTTSVVLTVHGTSAINPYQINEFQVLPNVPNPFTDITRLGFYTPFDDRIELQVYNILGKLMHEEKLGAPPGEHFFRFDGNALLPGTYFYRVTNSSKFYTGKFIKSR